jgi:hypothetical protein
MDYTHRAQPGTAHIHPLSLLYLSGTKTGERIERRRRRRRIEHRLPGNMELAI